MPYDAAGFFADYAMAKQIGIALSPGVASARVEVAWELYKNAMAPDLGFHIFGRHKHDQYDDAQSSNLPAQMNAGMVGIRKSELENFGKLNDQTKGSALKISNNIWSFIINDSWLLGGAHGHMPFYAASPVNAANIYNATHILSITGREVLGLALCGYRSVTGHASLGQAYVCQDHAAADAMTLTSYLQAVTGITSRADADQIFADAGIVIA
jgi:hypothetical protein